MSSPLNRTMEITAQVRLMAYVYPALDIRNIKVGIPKKIHRNTHIRALDSTCRPRTETGMITIYRLWQEENMMPSRYYP